MRFEDLSFAIIWPTSHKMHNGRWPFVYSLVQKHFYRIRRRAISLVLVCVKAVGLWIA